MLAVGAMATTMPLPPGHGAVVDPPPAARLAVTE